MVSFAKICQKYALIFPFNIQKSQKIAILFYFWQTVSKQAKCQPCNTGQALAQNTKRNFLLFLFYFYVLLFSGKVSSKTFS